MARERRQQFKRFTKRIEVTFSSGGARFRGISSDLSEGGLFIRTRHGLTPGNVVNIELYLSEDKVSCLRGKVIRTVKTSLSTIKNGMGIELIERDQAYLDFVRSFNGVIDKSEEPAVSPHQPLESIIVACRSCNAKNRIPKEKLAMQPRCGRCGEVLNTKGMS